MWFHSGATTTQLLSRLICFICAYWLSMVCLLVAWHHFSCIFLHRLLLLFHIGVKHFSKELFHISNLLLSLAGANHALYVFHLPFFSSNYLLPDFFSPLPLEYWYCVPTCLPLNIFLFVSLMSSPACEHPCIVFWSLMTGSSWKQITLFSETLNSFDGANQLSTPSQTTDSRCLYW